MKGYSFMAEKVKYKMEKKRKASLTFGAVALALMIALAVGVFMQRSGLTPKSYLVFATGSTPDAYGNKIAQLTVFQPDWFDATSYLDYESEMTIEISANTLTWMQIHVHINKTLCVEPLADDYTRIYMNISEGEKSNELLTWFSTASDGDFYRVIYNCTSWTPATDTAYDVDVAYQAYY